MRLLRSIFGDDMEEVELQGILEMAQVKTYPPATVLCQEGSLEHTFYIIEAGQVEVLKNIGDGEQVFLLHRGVGEFFGEMALIEKASRSATVKTVEESRLLEISAEDFFYLLRHNPSVAYTMVSQLSSRLRESDQTLIADLRIKNEELARAYRELKEAQARLVEKERMERDLEIAREVQLSLLPTSFPHLAGFTFAARNRPAREVGGDFYDVVRVDDHHVGLIAADVSGKSVPAALFMTMTRSLFLAQARQHHSPRQVLLNVHDLLLEVSTSEMFVTAFYAVVDIPFRTMFYVRAGHEQPILYNDKTGKQRLFQSQGRFMGCIEGLELEEKFIQLGTGDVLVLYSDGITDALNERGEFYGLERLTDTVTCYGDCSAEELCDRILQEVTQFQGKAVQFDDITLLVMKLEE